jgi:hypothetical protein
MIVSLAIISISNSVLASAPVANIKVTGSITPPNCTIHGQSEVDLEYKFDIDRNNLPEPSGIDKTIDIGEKTQSIQIVCDAKTFLSLTPIDQRADSAYKKNRANFGLGFFDGDKQIGSYSIAMLYPKTKQDSSSPFVNGTIIAPRYISQLVYLENNDRYIWGKDGTDIYQEAEIFSVDFLVNPRLNPEFKKSWSDESLDGHTVLAFSFAIN